MEGCRKAVAERILRDMLGSIKDSTGGGWKVLVMDEFTTRVMSSTLKMSDIQDCNVSVVENLSLARQPMPLVGVYFIQPNPNSIAELLRDFEGAKPLYPSVHIFFSSKIPSSAMTKIKGCPALLNVVKTMKESNIEFLTVDSHSFVTDNPYAPALLLGDQADIVQQNEAERELNIIATRLGTALATLNVYPVVRYRKGKAPEAGDAPGAQARATLTQRLATKLIDRVDAMQLPNNNECDVLILDRTYDPVAPFIHEWTYETLVYDLLKVEGNIFKYPGEPGPLGLRTEEKEAILEETDSVWCELRHTFIADVYTTLAARFKEFQSKNKAAKLGGGGIKDKGDMSASSIRQLITALPQFREVLSRLSLHIQISSDLQTVTNQRILADVGELEQDLVLGEKNSKDMVEFLTENQQRMTPKDKVRLIMCYCATHPEKLDPTKLAAWSKAAKLSQHDMMMVTNLALLGCAVMKQPEKLEKASGSFFGGKKGKERPELLRRKKADDGGYALFRFEPLLKDVLCDLAANKLPVDQFPFVRAPGPDVASGPSASAQSVRTGGGGRQGMTWTKRDPEPGVGGATGRRLIVFIIGGAVRSEMRVAHELSKTLKREVILGSTSMETPTSFLDHLARMNTQGTMYGV